MKNYYRLMLGAGSTYVKACLDGNFIGVDFLISQDLTGRLPEEWRAFNQEFIPIWMESNPAKTKIAAGLACGNLWTVAKGIKKGEIVLCPDGAGRYRVGEIVGDYYFAPGEILPHRRPVQWRDSAVERSSMSEALRKSSGVGGTVSRITGYADEIERQIGGTTPPILIATDETVEDPSAFAMEKHLEDFLVQNWSQTELGRDYDIYQEDGERVGQQYATDTGPLDILAVSKDKSALLVVELKKGRASDVVVGQVLRYMGYVKEELAEEGQRVKGVIIALEDDQRIRRALSVVPDVTFYRYQVSFKLIPSV